MIRATLKMLPEEAAALVEFLTTRQGECEPGTHAHRVVGYVAGVVRHEQARVMAPPRPS